MKLCHSLWVLVAVGGIHFGCSSSDNSDAGAGAKSTTDEAWSSEFAGEGGQGTEFIGGLIDDVSGKNVGNDLKDLGNPFSDALTLVEEKSCAPIITSGSMADADSDGIPDALTQTFNCSEDKDGSRSSVKGTVEVEDKNNASKTGGYKVTVSDLVFSGEFSSEELSMSMAGTMSATAEVTVNGNTYTSEQNSSSSSIMSMLGLNIDSSTKSITKTVYVADEDGNDDPFDKGTITSITGTIQTKSNVEPVFDITIDVKGENLVKDSCAGGFESGSVSFIDRSGNETKATFGSDCKATWSRNGAALEQAVE